MHKVKTRVVQIGGVDKAELRARLTAAGVLLNAAAEELFAHPAFITSPQRRDLDIVEVTVAELGCLDGASIAALHRQAAAHGLKPCPLELGPHLRLQYTDQAEGHLGQPPTRHRAPPGAVTVASLPPSSSDDVPKGFYLRRIEGVLWLRGYRSDPYHPWRSEDRFVFCRVLPAG